MASEISASRAGVTNPTKVGIAMNVHRFAIVGCPLLVLLTAITLVRTLVVVVTVQSQSMVPALDHGDRVLVIRHWPARLLRRGDIVVVWPWGRLSGDGRFHAVSLYIKRIVAMPGDTFDAPLGVSRILEAPLTTGRQDADESRVWIIPTAHCFLRGDNPAGSFDSTSWGPVPFKNVAGLVLMKLSRRDDSGNPEREEFRIGTIGPDDGGG